MPDQEDFYTYCRTFSEYYAPLDGKAHLYGRTFFNEDGSVCYEEVIEDDSTFTGLERRCFIPRLTWSAIW